MRCFFCGLVIECHKQSILSRIVERCSVRLVNESVGEDLTENLLGEVIFIRSVENAIFLGAFLAFGAFVYEVLPDQLLEMLEKEHTLGISDRQGTKRVEAWILSVSLPL